jgi:hypothetical protein
LERLELENVGIFYGHLVYFTAILVYFVAIWYNSWLFGIFFPILVDCTKKNLATLLTRRILAVGDVPPVAKIVA